MDTQIVFKKMAYVMLIIATAMTTACAPKKADAPSTNRTYRNSNAFSPNGGINSMNPGNPSGGSLWGSMYSFDYVTLTNFMVNVTDLGNVSSNPNDSTGIRFRGAVSTSGQSGYVNMLVWDDKAAAGQADPYYWSLNVISGNVNVMNGQGQASITVQDNEGTITFNGNVANGGFSGTATYNNSSAAGGGSGRFQFAIPTSAFFIIGQ